MVVIENCIFNFDMCWCPLLTKSPIVEEAQQYEESEKRKY